MSGRHVSPRQTPKRGGGGREGGRSGGGGGGSNVNESPAPPHHPPSKKADKSIEQQLGPEWSQDEITTFFNAVKEGRNDWEAIARSLPGRSSDSVKNLYTMQKNYLALHEASSLGLFTIVKSIYTMPGLLSGNEDTEETNTRRTRSRTASTPKTTNNKETTPKTPAAKPLPTRRTTRKQLFPEEPPTTPPKRTSTTTTTTYTSTTRTPSPGKSTPSSRKRRTPSSRHDSPPATPTRTPSTQTPNSSIPATPDSQLPLKLRGKALKGKISPLHPDGTPGRGTPSHTFHAPEEFTPAQRIIHDRLVSFLKSNAPKPHSSQHEVSLSPAGRWAVYEWFYSDIDRVYFQVNEFQECLNALGLSKIRKLTRVEWAHVRSAMGKPRRLSVAFLKQERTKLYNTRTNVRNMRLGETPIPLSTPDAGIIPTDIPSTLALNTKVLVYHHKALKKGVIQVAEEDGSRYRVLLDGHSNAIWIKDVDIMSMYADEGEGDGEDGTPQSLRRDAPLSAKRRKLLEMTPSNGRSAMPPRTYTKEELRNVAQLSGLLEKKDTLLAELTAMNNQAEKMLAQSQDYPSWFQQRYAVLIVKLDEVNRQLEPTLLRLHASRNSPTVAPPIARTSYTDISMLDFREQNWSESTVSDNKRRAQTLVKDISGQMPKFNPTSPMRDYISDCVCMLLQLQTCAAHVLNLGSDDASADVVASLDYMLSTLRPKSEENMMLFSEIEQSITTLKNKLTSRALPQT